MTWFQLYRLAKDDHKVSFDLVRRAQEAGAHVLVVTVDTPGRAKRPGELRNGLTLPFRPTLQDHRAGRGLAALADGASSQRSTEFSLPCALLR